MADGTLMLFNTCICQAPYVGVDCDMECTVKCENGGSCEYREGESFFCRCPEGFTGPLCQNKIVQCDSSVRCLNGGVCIEKTDPEKDQDPFQCQCPKGFGGTDCGVRNESPVLELPTTEEEHEQAPQRQGQDLDGAEAANAENTGKKRKGFSITTISVLAFCGIFLVMGIRIITRNRKDRKSFRNMASHTATAFDTELYEMPRNTEII